MSNQDRKMAGNEANSQTELFPGWSSVVHQPCEDPEESELPSTVDMAAFSTGLNVEPTNNTSQNTNATDSESDSEVDSSNSGSEVSASCSQSDSSDSDTSTSSQESSSRSPSPEFSVTSSQTNGLRLTIATVKKSSNSPTNEKIMSKATTTTTTKPINNNCSSSSDSPYSTDTDSDSETSVKSKVSGNKASVKSVKDNNVKKVMPKTRTKIQEKKDERKCIKKDVTKVCNTRLRSRQKKNKKMASLPLSRGSTYSSSDSDESDTDSAMLASCSLEQIREEDLAAILPDQQECDAFGDFECNRTDKNSPQAGDMSGSDMELPQQAVNALIQRTTESSSECESHAPPNPNTLYANSLLQQFVAQTQILNTSCSVLASSQNNLNNQNSTNNNELQNVNSNNNNNGNSNSLNNSNDVDLVKRKRGRPRKNYINHNKNNKIVENKTQTTEYCGGDPNVSPDSGIQNSPDHVSSPEPSLSPNSKIKNIKDDNKKITIDKHITKNAIKSNKKLIANNQTKELTKVSVTSNRFDRLLYANTDRVLYPPRRKVGRPPITKKGPGRPPKHHKQSVIMVNELTNLKSTTTDTKTTIEKLQKNLNKTKHQEENLLNRPVLKTKNKTLDENMKKKYTTLKNLKVMHSKHKHRKHKKYKFKILKPITDTVTNDPKINVEIDKLVTDFMKSCVISITKPPKENVPDIIVKTITKKVSKKRKTVEYTERKKKTLNVSTTVNKVTNLNEQRLPLKKRHHLFFDGKCNVNKQNKTDEDVIEPLEEEKDNSLNNSSIEMEGRTEGTATAKNSMNNNNNNNNNVNKTKEKISLESLVCELKMKRGLSARNSVNNNNNNNLSNDNNNKKIEKDDKIDILQPIVKVISCNTNPELIKIETTKKKIRKRRAINRTGFPTIKKKKKKIVLQQPPPPPQQQQQEQQQQKKQEEIEIETNRIIKDNETTDDSMSKWEVLSECDSLPQDERTEIGERSESGDLDEISLEASIERLKSRLDKKKRKRSCEKNCDNINGYPKRRLRDISPASSIEHFNERRLREDRTSASGDETNKRNKKAPRWRKKYLIAGLFSDYYKEDDETARIKQNENVAKSRNLIYNPSEHPHGLLPLPDHCGKNFRSNKITFQLPYDLWWQHTHSQLPGRDVVPSWNYRKIRTNIYNIKTTTGACEPQPCNCTSSANCGDDCINRLVLAECPASHRCQNQRIQRHEWAPGIEKFMTESKGWGVQTKLPIKNGEFILEYVGEVVSDQEFKERMGTIYVNDTHHYCLHLDGGLVIDGHRMGGDGRFVNHSCQPNCEMQKWSVNGQFRMALFALRDIEDGEELTYDYNFSLFNPAEGQECKCGSDMCRGVIGGKSQRVRQLPSDTNNKNNNNNSNSSSNNSNTNNTNNNNNNNNNGRVGRPRKNQAKKSSTNPKDLQPQPSMPIIPQPQVKPMSHQQKCVILERHCFLLRNLSRVRRLRERSNSSISVTRQQTESPLNHSTAFINHLNALEKPRNIRTRRLAQAEDDPELNKTVKLAAVLRDVWNAVTKAKDENEELLSVQFMNMPSKRKVPDFYQRTSNSIDLSTIEQNIATGVYRTPESFNIDMNRLFTNYIRFYGRTNEIGIAATKLKKIYTEAKQLNITKFEDVLGKKPSPNFVSNKNKNEEEDIIRCICGMHHDEGLMIQCERCLVWQHCECVKADVSAASYHCEQCVPREVDYEIPLEEFTEHGHRYYMTLLRGDLQLRQGDTVYVLRDIPIPGTDKKHTYNTIGKINYADLDIFRIERLWKDSKNGQRFAYGHHYLRPHETYHEPTRKFFPNEVMRVPLYEAVPVELIISHCWVMDINTYCKGRPIGAPEEHIYICEYRVDKNARLFSKVSKSKYPICTKSFAFERFDARLKVSRTYTPHDLDPALVKPRGRKPQENEEPREVITETPINVPVLRTPVEQKARLNKILLNLLSKMPNKQVLDVSYLLEGGRRRKKQNVENVKS